MVRPSSVLVVCTRELLAKGVVSAGRGGGGGSASLKATAGAMIKAEIRRRGAGSECRLATRILTEMDAIESVPEAPERVENVLSNVLLLRTVGVSCHKVQLSR